MSMDNPASSEHAPIASSSQAIGTTAQDLPRERNPHASRFRVVLAGLAGIGVIAIAIAVVVAARNSGTASANGKAWSSWAPDSSGSTGVSEIAEHVALFYRFSASQQLDVITPMSLSQQTAAGTTTGSGLLFAVNTSSSGKKQSLALLNGKTVAYNLCGLGAKSCQLAGTPSINRMLLLRREALELALYTFKYINGSQNVVVVLPPSHATTTTGPQTKVTVAVAFLRSGLAAWLQVPLVKTLQQYPPGMSQLNLWSKSTEAAFVSEITASALFSTQVESLQEGGRVVVLTQLPAQ
jgi:hypothetical protein